jgi:hypothetical protein
VLKLQADFVHGYRLGAAVFYVSTTNFEGKHREVTAAERDGWNQYWQSRDREFEEFLQRDPLLYDFSNKFFYVWDCNHRLLAWTDHINKVHKNDLQWHYCVRSIVLNTQNAVTDYLTTMHDINKAIENLHVKSNFVHVLHRMQKVGSLPLKEFTSLLTPEEIEQARVLIELAVEKKPWYPIPRAKFLEYLHSISTFLPHCLRIQFHQSTMRFDTRILLFAMCYVITNLYLLSTRDCGGWG